MKSRVLAAALLLAAFPHFGAAQDVRHRAHAHNDYEHARPLFDALGHGFRSIEADVHLVDGELLVAHDRNDVRRGRTLQSLYLDRLRDRIRRNGGRVYGDSTSLLLLVDVKSDAEATYAVLRELLGRYEDMLTTFQGAETLRGPVTVVVSGNRVRDVMLNEDVRYAAYDGRPEDLTERHDLPASFVPLISAPWSTVSSWRGDGRMPEEDRRRLRALVEQAHAQGRMLRFWATADTPAVWDVLHEEGVDLIGADNLQALAAFLQRR